jgi:N-acyl-D-aspartate/D-glutamate deacylase
MYDVILKGGSIVDGTGDVHALETWPYRKAG